MKYFDNKNDITNILYLRTLYLRLLFMERMLVKCDRPVETRMHSKSIALINCTVSLSAMHSVFINNSIM